MDDAPYTGDLDLDAVGTRDDLAALLRTVHIRADKPSLRTLEARTRHSATPLSKTAVAEMLKGVRFPRKAVMVAFLQACGMKDDNVESWQRTWERVAADEEGTTPPAAVRAPAGPGHAAFAQQPTQVRTGGADKGRTKLAHGDRKTGGSTVSADLAPTRQLRDQIKQLNSDNKRLRAQLAATQRQTTEQLQPDDAASDQRPRSPVVTGRELGVLLRALREEKGLRVEQVAEYLLCSTNKVKRMETGFRSGTVRDVRDLCSLYEVAETARRDHLMELARESKRITESPEPKSHDTSRLDLSSDARIGASLKIIVENLKTALSVQHPVFLDEIAAACNDFAAKSTDWRQGQVVIPSTRYNESVRHQYESSKEWVFATSIPEYLDAWTSDLGEEFMEAHRRSRARVTRIFVFDDASAIRPEDLEVMARQNASQIEVRVYVDNEDDFFTFPTDISRDFSIIDDEVISITRSYGRNNFETVWYYHDVVRLARFARIRQDLLKHSKTLEHFQDLYRRSL